MFLTAARIFTFSFSAALPIIFGSWSSTIALELFTGYFGFSNQDAMVASSWYTSSFLYGIIVGCFIWPELVKHLEKRTSLLIGLLVTGASCFVMATFSQFWVVCGLRFLCGIGHNFSSVGKDFIYEFAHSPMARQYGFSAKSALNMIALFVGPFAGYLIFRKFDGNFASCVLAIGFLYLAGILLFIIVFYVFYNVNKEIAAELQKVSTEHISEEEAKIVVKENEEEVEPLSLWQVTKVSLTNRYMRSMILTYTLSNAVNKTFAGFTAIFCVLAWQDGGLGLPTELYSFISFLSFIPAVIMLFTSPLYVPKRVSFFNFIKTFLFIIIAVILLIPGFRIIFTESSIRNLGVFFVISLIFWGNPKQFSPFISILINNEVAPENRTSINALMVLFQNSVSAILINLMAPVFSYTVFDPRFTQFQPYNAFIPFGIIAVICGVPVFLLTKEISERARKTSEIMREKDLDGSGSDA